MSKFDKSMTEIFEVSATIVEEMPLKPATPREDSMISNLEKDLDSDYKEAREMQHILIQKGNQAIDHLLAIASESEHPRAFEVVATLLKNTAEANEKLLQMQKTMRELKNIKRSEPSVNVDKAIFVGSTSELSKLLKSNNVNK